MYGAFLLGTRLSNMASNLLCACTQVYVPVNLCAPVHLCMHSWMYACMYEYTYIHTSYFPELQMPYTYTHTYINKRYIHTSYFPEQVAAAAHAIYGAKS